jgi:hypothetical protein
MAVSLGMKKPLNMMENPIRPDIKRGPPRFVWSRKSWKVDVGDTLKELATDTQHSLGNAVLVQSRDYNQFRYGVSSHKDVVNKEFRPPLVTHEDMYSLTRIPRPPVVGRINPGSSHGYLANNNHNDAVYGKLTDRVKTGIMRPTYYCPLSKPDDNSVLPDLEYNNPQVSASSGFNTSFTMDGDINSLETFKFTGEYNRPQVSASSGFNSNVLVDGSVNRDFNFDYNLPSVSAHSGYNSPMTVDGRTGKEFLIIDHNKLHAKQSVLNPAPLHMDGGSNFSMQTQNYRLKSPLRMQLSNNAVPQYSASGIGMADTSRAYQPKAKTPILNRSSNYGSRGQSLSAGTRGVVKNTSGSFLAR